ncbi:MAG: hypothetical protein ACI9XK_003382, partial [Granulosicoccus sp.]
ATAIICGRLAAIGCEWFNIVLFMGGGRRISLSIHDRMKCGFRAFIEL